ncbi:MAG: F0F1 ATP synthase subunit beta, partial [Clostridia bacterium]|nr:F0F1 ATP synthase subunit beta [Clostridia bacterium]
MPAGSKGLITRIIGPVVDVTFPSAAQAPEIYNAVEVDTKNGKLLLETLQQLGNGEIRCISMHATDGLSRGMTAVDTGAPLSVPVGESTLG